MGVVMRRERDRERERACVCVVNNSHRQKGGDVKVKYIKHSLASLITSELGRASDSMLEVRLSLRPYHLFNQVLRLPLN